MLNSTRIEELKSELEQAERDARPVIVEKTKETKDEVAYENKTTGTIRQDLKGGRMPELEERPKAVEEVRLIDKPFDKELGEVMKDDADERVIKLNSGTIRIDVKKVEVPINPIYCN